MTNYLLSKLDNLCQSSSVIKNEVVNGLSILITDFGGYLQISLFGSDINLKSDMTFQLGFSTKQNNINLHGFIVRGDSSLPNVAKGFSLHNTYIKCDHQVFARMLYYTVNIPKSDIIV